MTHLVTTPIDISYTLPLAPEKHIKRPHIVQTIRQIFDSKTQTVCIEAPSGYGKSAILREFAAEVPEICFGTFLKPDSRVSYDPVLARFDLANQVYWELNSKRYPENTDPSDGDLRTLWQRCAKRLSHRNKKAYILIDGLNHIPPSELSTLKAILDLLPFGLQTFKFLLSASSIDLVKDIRRNITIKTWRLPPFALHESDQYFRDIVQVEEKRKRFHDAFHGVPALLASVRRQLLSGGAEDLDPLAFDGIQALFEEEWQGIEKSDPGIKRALAYIIAKGGPVDTETIAKNSEWGLAELNAEFKKTSFLTNGTNGNTWLFCSEQFQKFAGRKLRRYVLESIEQITMGLLSRPDSDEAIARLPAYLARTQDASMLVSWLNESRLASILKQKKSTTALHPLLETAVSMSYQAKDDSALAAYAICRSAIGQIGHCCRACAGRLQKDWMMRFEQDAHWATPKERRI